MRKQAHFLKKTKQFIPLHPAFTCKVRKLLLHFSLWAETGPASRCVARVCFALYLANRKLFFCPPSSGDDGARWRQCVCWSVIGPVRYGVFVRCCVRLCFLCCLFCRHLYVHGLRRVYMHRSFGQLIFQSVVMSVEAFIHWRCFFCD